MKGGYHEDDKKKKSDKNSRAIWSNTIGKLEGLEIFRQG